MPRVSRDHAVVLTDGDEHALVVDREDAERVASRAWRLRVQANGRLTPITDVYYRSLGRNREVSLYRFVVFGTRMPPKGARVTPRNGNPLDARRSNLRVTRGRPLTFRAGDRQAG